MPTVQISEDVRLLLNRKKLQLEENKVKMNIQEIAERAIRNGIDAI